MVMAAPPLWSAEPSRSPMDELKALRDRLDAVDRRIVEAVGERMKLVAEVTSLKLRSKNVQVRDVERESALLGRVVALCEELDADSLLLTRLYRDLLDHSVRVQQESLVDASNHRPKTIRVAYQGAVGAYSYLAAKRHFSVREAEFRTEGFPSFEKALNEVAEERADYAVLPIENTTAGSINEAYDLLASMELSLVGEEVQPVEHCLLASPGARLGDIREVHSHPQALLQCSRFLRANGLRAVAAEDTAGSCLLVLDHGEGVAAIASAQAAEIYGLDVLAKGIANQPENFTRMVIVARHKVAVDLRIPAKTSVILATRHEEGALLNALDVFARHHLNLTKLESRPRPRNPWEYLFYLDFEGNIDDPGVQAALRELVPHTSHLKVLGSYAARTVAKARPASPVPTVAADPLSSRAVRPADSVVSVGGVVIGGKARVVLVRSQHPDRRLMSALSSVGGGVVWTDQVDRACLDASHNAFIPLVVEVEAVQQVHDLKGDVAGFVVPDRHMSDQALLQALGRIDRPVILVRGSSASVDEWLAAGETLLRGGNHQVILCDSGVTGFDGRRGVDVGALLDAMERTHLPIVADTQRIPGDPTTSRICAAVWAVGVHGVVVQAPDGEIDAKALAGLMAKAQGTG
jgi:chorismate mutase / prephenate dehydratase